MYLRKNLSNARLISIRQHGFDRILILEFESGRGKNELIIEAFGDGNVILVDQEGIILRPLTHAKYTKRLLKGGATYDLPPERGAIEGLSAKAFRDALAEATGPIVRTFASVIGVGGPISRMVLNRCGINHNHATEELSLELSKRITDTLTELLDAATSSAPVWITSSNDSKISTTEPHSISMECTIHLVKPDSQENELEIEYLSDAVDAALPPIGYESQDHSVVGNRNSDPWERRRIQQKNAIEAFEKKIEQKMKEARTLKEKTEWVETLRMEILTAANEDGWESVSTNIDSIPWIEAIDPAKKHAKIRLPDENNRPSGAPINLNLQISAWASSDQLFKVVKRLRKKRDGAESALKLTESKKRRKDAVRMNHSPRRSVRKNRLWFERHRWAAIGNGRIFLGGRNAKGNDAIVKKHLKAGDLYFHADVHGAPSCSLLRSLHIRAKGQDELGITEFDIFEEASEIRNDELTEAAIFATSWSRAWGVGRTQAFHAEPGQVSKRTETGEALGRGAFVIRGQRTWYRNPSSYIALGLARIGRDLILIPGSEKFVRLHCKRWGKVTVGTEKASDVANRISRGTGIPVEEILGHLPASKLNLEDFGLMRYEEEE